MLGCEWSSDVRAADLLQGSAGLQGPQGDTGSQGPQGPQGAKGLNWKAAWNAVDNYVADDAVSYNGSGIGRAAGRGRGENSVVAVFIIKKKKEDTGRTR